MLAHKEGKFRPKNQPNNEPMGRYSQSYDYGKHLKGGFGESSSIGRIAGESE